MDICWTRLLGRRYYSVIVGCLLGHAYAQAPMRGPVVPDADTSQVAFEVVSIKPNPAPPGRVIVTVTPDHSIPLFAGRRFKQSHATVKDLIIQAYDVLECEILSLPSWGDRITGEYYYVEAKSSGPATVDEVRAMLRTMLADRFRLRSHRELRELPVYELRLAKAGIPIRELNEDEPFPTFSKHPADSRMIKGLFYDVVLYISRHVDRPVIDGTSIPSSRKVEYLNPRLQIASQDPDGDVMALQGDIYSWMKAIGLKLEPTKRVADMLVIDNIGRPSPN